MCLILARVGLLVVNPFHKAIVCSCKQGAKCRTKPIYPVIAWEASSSYSAPEAAGGIQGSSGEKGALTIVSI